MLRSELIAQHRRERERWYRDVAAQGNVPMPPLATLEEIGRLNAECAPGKEEWERRRRLREMATRMQAVDAILQADASLNLPTLPESETVPLSEVEIPTPMEWVTTERKLDEDEKNWIGIWKREIAAAIAKQAGEAGVEWEYRLGRGRWERMQLFRKYVVGELVAKGWIAYTRYDGEGYIHLYLYPVQPPLLERLSLMLCTEHRPGD